MYPRNEDPRSAIVTATDIMIKQHSEINSMDSVWLDSAVSEYCFESANADREVEYRLALYAAMHQNTAKPLQSLMAKAVHEKAEREVNSYVENTDEAA